MKNNILLFVKYPNKGEVKTRLAKSIGDSKAVSLYKYFLDEILLTLRGVSAAIWICYYPEKSAADMVGWLGDNYYYVPQIGQDLGERLQHCFKMSIEKGFQKTIVLASDIPEISEEIINNAFNSLDDNDVVIGPSYDGGYYLLGFREQSYVTGIFDDIVWSTNRVFKETLIKMESYNLKYSVLKKVADIDTIDDYSGFLMRKQKNIAL